MAEVNDLSFDVFLKTILSQPAKDAFLSKFRHKLDVQVGYEVKWSGRTFPTQSDLHICSAL